MGAFLQSDVIASTSVSEQEVVIRVLCRAGNRRGSLDHLGV